MSDAHDDHRDHHKLDRAFVGGVAWTAGAKWLSQLVSWPSVLITAHLLGPANFGIVQMAGFYFVVTNVVAEFGIGMAVLQMRELDMAVAAQLNTIASGIGIMAFVVSVAAAPLIAWFFRSPELNHLVIVSSFSFILTSLEAIPLGLLQRDMNYRYLSIAESVQAVITAVVSVACAFAGLAYWSLIAGNLAGRAGNIALAIYWRPVPFARPRRSQVMAPLRFGMHIATQRVVGTISSLSDGMVIGRTLGQSPLGAYSQASSLANTPAEKIGALILRVTGPLFARVQNDVSLMRRYFLIFSETLAIAIFPLVIGLAVVAPEAIQILLGAQWAAAAMPLRWLSVFMAVRTMGYPIGQLLTTLRFTRFGTWMALFNLVLMTVAFYFASRWGVGTVALAWLVLSPITFVPVAAKVFHAIGCGLRQYLNSLTPALVGSSAMLLVLVAVRPWLNASHWPVFARLAAEVTAGAVAYCAVIMGGYRTRVMPYVRFFLKLRRPENADSEDAIILKSV